MTKYSSITVVLQRGHVAIASLLSNNFSNIQIPKYKISAIKLEIIDNIKTSNSMISRTSLISHTTSFFLSGLSVKSIGLMQRNLQIATNSSSRKLLLRSSSHKLEYNAEYGIPVSRDILEILNPLSFTYLAILFVTKLNYDHLLFYYA